jgi:hypothetical protein
MIGVAAAAAAEVVVVVVVEEEEVVQVEQHQIGVIPVTHAAIPVGLTHVILEIRAASGQLILVKCEQIRVMQEVG